MSKYILLQPDEDGNPAHWINKEELDDIKQFMEDYGIEEFLSDFPAEDGEKEKDPQYWKDGQAMLLEVKIKKVVPVKIVKRYEIK